MNLRALYHLPRFSCILYPPLAVAELNPSLQLADVF
jgi:hypothetical protein